ncbi:MAG: hypothetical protein Q8L30_02720 [bacterium]|nr:hypothetical protein [bacterium]
MGYLSALLVRHDALHETRDDTELGNKIYDAVVRFNRRDDSRRVSSGIEMVAGNIHASDIGVVVIEGNTAYHVEEILHANGSLPDWSKAEAHLVDLVKRLGYKVIRPKKK